MVKKIRLLLVKKPVQEAFNANSFTVYLQWLIEMNKGTTLLLIAVLVLSSLFMAENVNTQLTASPSLPEFSLAYHAYLYYYPPTYTTDPYTGKNLTASYEHWIRQTAIDVTISNQPFTPYEIKDENGVSQTINLYYLARSKGHFEDQWVESQGGLQTADYASGKTVIYTYGDSTPANGQIDFQVQAYVGYITYRHPPNTGGMITREAVFNGTESGWSTTQTITINDPNGGAGEFYVLPESLQSTASITPSPAVQTPTATPVSTPEASPIGSAPSNRQLPDLTIVYVLILGLAFLLLLVYVRKIRKRLIG